jgi:hypothetical protein
VFFYIGEDVETFAKAFSEIGSIMVPYSRMGAKQSE